MRYVQAIDGAFVRHVFDLEPTRWDEDNFCRVANLTEEKKAEFGVSKLKLVTPPAYDRAAQSLGEGDAIFVDGEWLQNWIVTDLTDDEAAALLEGVLAQARLQRNAKLAACDWTQLSDAPVNAVAWAEYRQALRDITEQGDPFNIVWPTEPGA